MENATKDVIEKVGFAAFAESKGLISNASAVNNDDSIHFSRASLYEFGERYFDLYEKLFQQMY